VPADRGDVTADAAILMLAVRPGILATGLDDGLGARGVGKVVGRQTKLILD
jgi:hypothetical protein